MRGGGGAVEKGEGGGWGGEGERLLMMKGDGQEEGEGFHIQTHITCNLSRLNKERKSPLHVPNSC